MGQHPILVKTKIATETELRKRKKETLVQDEVSNNMTSTCQSRKDASNLSKPLIGPRQITRVACWNVRTSYQTGKTKQLSNEMKRYNIDICGLSEV